MPKPYPREFRDDVVRVARNREPGVHLKQIAADFGISESCLNGWLKAADVEDGVKPGVTAGEHAELREARKRIRLLEQENDVRVQLTRAAFSLLLETPDMPEESRTELLACLDYSQVCASLLHLLQYRHRTGCSPTPGDLSPYVGRLKGIYRHPGDLLSAKKWLLEHLSTLGYIGDFTGPNDVEWLFDSLSISDPGELVIRHLQHQREYQSDHPLKTLLLWRAIVGGPWGRQAQRGVPAHLDPWGVEGAMHSLLAAIELLISIDPGRFYELRWTVSLAVPEED